MRAFLAIKYPTGHVEHDGHSEPLHKLVKACENLTQRSNGGSISLYSGHDHAFGYTEGIYDQKSASHMSHNDVHVLCNGNIYNIPSLIDTYHLPRTVSTASHCISYLYAMFGFESTVKLLNGDFSLVIITPTQLHFARDFAGMRPLYYGVTPRGNIVYASTVKCVSELCNVSIKEVTPGIYTYDMPTETIHQYEYTLACKPTLHGYATERQVRNTLHNAVHVRTEYALKRNLHIVCMLSGGIDSSIITSIVCQYVLPENVYTYTVGLEGSQDLYYAQRVADYLGTTHTSIIYTEDEAVTALPFVIHDLESYTTATVRASVPMWILASHIPTDSMVFTGEGADELFCGYRYFHNVPSVQLLEQESVNLVRNMHKYALLRVERCTSAHSLLTCAPFMDPHVVNIALHISGHMRAPRYGIEKYMLREMFSDNYLPVDALWRRKADISDKWYKCLGVSEQEHYKLLFDSTYPYYIPKTEQWHETWTQPYEDNTYVQRKRVRTISYDENEDEL